MISVPDFIPANTSKLEGDAVSADQHGYQLSDQDMFRRFPGFVKGNRLASNQIFNEFSKGNTTLGPQIQSELMTAGLTGATGSFGDSVGALAPGSAGEASLAKNLGIGVQNFQLQNDAQRWGHLLSFGAANQPRQFGLTGPDIAQVDLANIAGQNNANQQVAALQEREQQQKAQQAASSQSGQNAAIGAGATILAGVLVAF